MARKKIVKGLTKLLKKKKKKSKSTTSGTQPIFKKKYSIKEGARVDPETGGSVRAARAVAEGQAGKVTRGKQSLDKGMAEAVSKGEKARAKKVTSIEREIIKLKNKKDLTKTQKNKLDTLNKKVKKLDIKSEKAETSRITKAAISSSTTKRKDKGITVAGEKGTRVKVGLKPKERDMLFGNTSNGITADGELIGNPTLKQIQLAQSDRIARSWPAGVRKRLAMLEERLLTKGYGTPTTSSVGRTTKSDKSKRRNITKSISKKPTVRTKVETKKLQEETRKNPISSETGKAVQRMMAAVRKRGKLKKDKR